MMAEKAQNMNQGGTNEHEEPTTSNNDGNPPLPPEITNIKQEVNEDLEKPSQDNLDLNYEPESKKAKEDSGVMCKNFFRGTCTRGLNCIFEHKIILTQLKDVYRFCNDFQNTRCDRPKCRFVHATISEKMNFLRTGYLPPHALQHMKDTLNQKPTTPTTLLSGTSPQSSSVNPEPQMSGLSGLNGENGLKVPKAAEGNFVAGEPTVMQPAVTPKAGDSASRPLALEESSDQGTTEASPECTYCEISKFV